jgi:hypothetical protein
LALSVTTQAPVPEQPPPLQPVSPAPAVNVTLVPLSKGAVQLLVQLLMPAGFDDTEPVPTTTAVKTGLLKLAVTVVFAVNWKVQVPVPEHPAPLQPVKLDALLGVAVRTIAAPTG